MSGSRSVSCPPSPDQLVPGGRRADPDSSDPLRIAILAPPWLPVPPRGYGGIERVIALLCEELVDRGHDVTLFAAPGSHSSARTYSLLGPVRPERIGSGSYEIDHVARAFDHIDAEGRRGLPFDVVHDHCRYAALAVAARLSVPLVHTIHDCFNDEAKRFYTAHGHKATVVGISKSQVAGAPSELGHLPVVPNPIALRRWPLRFHKDDYLLWMGRMSHVKGPHRAIAVARQAGRRLVLAGPLASAELEFFEAEVQPHIDGSTVEYIGEVGGGVKVDLLAGAAALLMPIRWHEPFGIVMVEALACGTPVLAYPEGAATDIVLHGVNGMLVSGEEEMAKVVSELSAINPRACRASIARQCDAPVVASRYESIYRGAALRSSGAMNSWGNSIDASPTRHWE